MIGFLADLRREFSGYNGKRFSQDLMAGITVDATGIQTFSRFIQAQQAHGTHVFFTGASPAFRTAMDRGGVTQLVGPSAFYWSAMDALSDIAQESQTV